MTNEEALKEAKKKYKETVLLPKTEFSMKAGLQRKEPELQAFWENENVYGGIRAERANSPAWVLHDGPPYANGDAHTGTGMNKILKDFVVKLRTMQGFNSPYIPGFDCHGLPIEHNVLKKLGGKRPEGMTAVQLREKCLEYANGFIETQSAQFKRTGTLGRWEKPYLTTNPQYEAGVLQVFRELVQRGYITRAKRPVHWSWAARSALAEAELEYEDREDLSIFVLMKTTGASDGATDVGRELAESGANLLIWTTTPWTMPANRAIAASVEAEYALVEFSHNGNPTSMVVAEELREAVCEKAGLTDAKLVKNFSGEDLAGLTYEQPLWGSDCPVVFADYVTLTDGTGLVHTAPGHGKEDFETGKKEGVPPVCPVSPTGAYYKDDRLREELQLGENYADERGWFEFINGQHIYKVNDAIAEKLREQGSLLFCEKFMHSYPHCWRTHKPVIFRVTEQWFVDVDHVDPDTAMNPHGKPLRERILDEIKNVEWFPAWGEKRISAMVSGRPDWCISRQRNWGIPIPAFLDEESGETCMTLETVDHVVSLVAEHGSNVWFDDENWPTDKLLPDDVRPDQFKGKKLAKMDDIFDVWFESGSSHRSVMLSDDELKDKFPANLYLEGDDQHRGWFQVSLILSVATQGKSPFKQCLTSAFVVDEHGQKGSKSKGNIWAIDKGCNELGADLIRLYFASVNTSEPIPVTFDLIKGASDSYRKLRNTWRTMVANLADFTAEHDLVEYDELPELEKWALSKCAKMVDDVTASFNRYEFHTGMRALVHFVNITMSSQYVDVCKDPLYCAEKSSLKRRSIQTVYWTIGNVLVRMLAPVIPHTAEEMWAAFPHWDNAHNSVHLASWPESGKGLLQRQESLEAQTDLQFAIKAEVDRTLDRLRKDKKIGKGYDTNVTIGADTELASKLRDVASPEKLESTLAEVMNVSRVHLDTESEHGALQEFEPASDVAGLWVKVAISDETACVRCYRRTGDVGNNGKHEFLCDRCAEVVD